MKVTTCIRIDLDAYKTAIFKRLNMSKIIEKVLLAIKNNEKTINLEKLEQEVKKDEKKKIE